MCKFCEEKTSLPLFYFFNYMSDFIIFTEFIQEEKQWNLLKKEKLFKNEWYLLYNVNGFDKTLERIKQCPFCHRKLK